MKTSCPFSSSIHPAEGLLPILWVAWGLLYIQPGLVLLIGFALCFALGLRYAFMRKPLCMHTALLGPALAVLLSLAVSILWEIEHKSHLQLVWLSTFVAYSLIERLSVFLYRRVSAKSRRKEKHKDQSQRLYIASEQLLCHCLLCLSYLPAILLNSIWNGEETSSDPVLYVAPIATLLIIGYELTRHWLLRSRLHQEEWLPLLNSMGIRVGLTARSSLHRFENPQLYYLPTVRVLTVCNDMIYLESRKPTDICPVGGYDTPFQNFLSDGVEPSDLAASMVYNRFCGIHRPQPKCLLHYSLDGQECGRYIYLFIQQIEAPDLLLCHQSPCEGKWWPIDQIEQHLNTRTIAPCLKSELPYICHTVRLAEQLRQAHVEKQSQPASFSSPKILL